MSLTSVRSYIRSRAKEIELKEWKDAFNSNNIPENILDKSYHIEMSDVTQGVSKNQSDQVINMPCTIKMFFKGFRNSADSIDTAVGMVENIIKKCCKPTNALTQSNGIKNVSFSSARYEQISDSNDNSVVATVVFNFLVIVNVE